MECRATRSLGHTVELSCADGPSRSYAAEAAATSIHSTELKATGDSAAVFRVATFSKVANSRKKVQRTVFMLSIGAWNQHRVWPAQTNVFFVGDTIQIP